MVKIRLMAKSDFSAVRKVWQEAGIDLSSSDTEQELARMIERNPKFCFVGEESNSIIAAVLGGFDGRRGWIHHLAVLPLYQKTGLGKMLLDTLITAFEKEKILKIKLEVVDSNKEVINFYLKQGWDLRHEITTMSMNLPRKKT